jgi:hypothetical protein
LVEAKKFSFYDGVYNGHWRGFFIHKILIFRARLHQGRVEVRLPPGQPEREEVLQIRYASYSVTRPQILDQVKALPDKRAMQVIYVKEEKPPTGKEPIAWFLATREPVNRVKEAYEYVG